VAILNPERIGLFGGSFDPVHHGHLLLAQDALEQLSLDRLVFVPAAINPHKLNSAPHASSECRLAMLREATRIQPRFSIDPQELERNGPSFTFDTVSDYSRKFAGARLFLLIGEDNLPKLHSWHEFEKLRELVAFVSFGRGGAGEGPAAQAQLGKTEQPVAIERLNRKIDISSTEIRTRVAKGLPIQYLVPESVRLLIHSHALYKHPV
jgi:nicotinate-nucleotide adenylyltransferase